jgi:hypothetical protein
MLFFSIPERENLMQNNKVLGLHIKSNRKSHCVCKHASFFRTGWQSIV